MQRASNAAVDALEVEAQSAERAVGRGEPLAITPGHPAPSAAPVPQHVIDVTRATGQPLDASVRREMESRFGHDFGRVRVHTDTRASASAAALSASAWTFGDRIAFRNGAYRPDTMDGQKLLAHELTHVVQQAPGVHRKPDERKGFAGDLSKALSRKLPEHIVKSPRDSFPVDEQAEKPCLSGPRCELYVQGSSLDFSRKAREHEQAAESAIKEKGKTPKLEPAPHLTALLKERAAGAMKEIDRVYVDVTIVEESAGAWRENCPHDPSRSCVRVPPSREEHARIYRQEPGQQQIGDMTRDDWLFETLRMITHEAGHARFVRDTPPGVPGWGEGTSRLDKMNHKELSEMYAQISEGPVDARIVLSETPSNPARAGAERHRHIREQLANQYLHGEQNIRGILTQLRCMNSCETVDRMVRATFRAATADWPAWLRDAALDVLADPANGLGWPMPPSPRTRLVKLPGQDEVLVNR